tara:strand:- start:910 stop:2166 length:1257 start_codon:yes stop_codon:yes gene_type:complete
MITINNAENIITMPNWFRGLIESRMLVPLVNDSNNPIVKSYLSRVFKIPTSVEFNNVVQVFKKIKEKTNETPEMSRTMNLDNYKRFRRQYYPKLPTVNKAENNMENHLDKILSKRSLLGLPFYTVRRQRINIPVFIECFSEELVTNNNRKQERALFYFASDILNAITAQWNEDRTNNEKDSCTAETYSMLTNMISASAKAFVRVLVDEHHDPSASHCSFKCSELVPALGNSAHDNKQVKEFVNQYAKHESIPNIRDGNDSINVIMYPLMDWASRLVSLLNIESRSALADLCISKYPKSLLSKHRKYWNDQDNNGTLRGSIITSITAWKKSPNYMGKSYIRKVGTWVRNTRLLPSAKHRDLLSPDNVDMIMGKFKTAREQAETISRLESRHSCDFRTIVNGSIGVSDIEQNENNNQGEN